MNLFSRGLAVALTGAFALASVTAAQPLAETQYNGQADLEAKYKEKLEQAFVEFGGWETDFEAAQARAKAENKVLFVYFSRSYAP